jgi:fucose permease
MSATADRASSISPLRSLAPLFVYFAASGIVTVMLGPLLPSLIARWQLQDAQAGTLFTTFFLGQLTGAWFATRNLRLSVLLGAALTAVGCVALAWASFHTAHFALFAAGLGLGAGLTAGNVIAGTSSNRRAQTLALLNVSWSIGAIASAALIRACAPFGAHVFFLLTAFLLTLGGLFLTTLPSPTAATLESASQQPARMPLPALALALFAVSMLLYIGNENALGGWLPSFAVRNSPAASAATITLLYWLSSLISRLLMPALLTLVTEAVLYRLSLCLLLLTQIGLIIMPHPSTTLVFAATILNGAALGPLYPLIVSFLLARTGQHPRLGRLFALASLGGASLPWLTGAVSTSFGGLRAGLLVPAAATLLLLAISPAIARSSARSDQPAAPTLS